MSIASRTAASAARISGIAQSHSSRKMTCEFPSLQTTNTVHPLSMRTQRTKRAYFGETRSVELGSFRTQTSVKREPHGWSASSHGRWGTSAPLSAALARGGRARAYLIALLTLLNVPPTGIFPGDIAVVDRRKTAGVRSIVLAILDGEFT
jgi:hypothetical protein